MPKIAVARLSINPEVSASAVAAPSSKSGTNRALLLAALAGGKTVLHGCLVSKDTLLMAEALRQLGVSVSPLDAPDTVIESHRNAFVAPETAIFLGNSGTSTRFLTAACCLSEGRVVIDGDDDMRQRPIAPLVEALKSIGFQIEAPTQAVPVEIFGDVQSWANLADCIEVDARQSTQFTSALMMIAPRLPKGLTVKMRNPEVKDGSGYLHLTTELMKRFGAQIEAPEFGIWHIRGGGYHAPASYSIEADYSACTYLWAANVLRGQPIEILNDHHAETAQPDAKAYAIIEQFPHMPKIIDGSMMQDAVPTLAVLAAFNHTPVRFIGIQNLRVKECDRIEAVHEGLNRLSDGLSVIEGDDLIVYGSEDLQAEQSETRIRTFRDHRIAMSFALAAYRLDGLVIEDPDCVGKTFPNYWEVMIKIGLCSDMSEMHESN